MASLRNVTRDRVLAVLERIDQLGEARFLELTGYQASTVYRLRHGGRSYPSKAVVGEAAGLRPSELFGGVAQVVPALQRLGFVVLRNGRPCPAVGLQATAARVRFEDSTIYRQELAVEPAAVFASGTNRPGEVRGMAAAGIDVGVAAPELNAEAEAELLKLEGTDVQVFIDSGAFGEVAPGPAGLEVVRPMTAADWADILALYRRVAEVLGGQVWLVAPDRVGDQAVTLERLRRYSAEVRELRQLGARILVPLQGGQLELEAFAREVDDALGFTDWLPALPCKKAATSPEAVASFVEARRPAHVHLLGLGPRNRRIEAYVDAFTGPAAPSYSLDANWITANVGRAGRRPRRYTAARDAAKAALGQGAAAAAVAELALLLVFAV